jgi:TatD DNase family protein
MKLVDTHCHIHSSNYELDANEVLKGAKDEGVEGLICVGTDLEDSRLATEFVKTREGTWASIGLHPHEAQAYTKDKSLLKEFEALAGLEKVMAVGECGLDYYYNHSPKNDQKEVLEYQLDIAQKYKLPVIFHVRSAFDDFWPLFDNFKGLKGVVHSFTAGRKVLEQALSRNLYLGLNRFSLLDSCSFSWYNLRA